MTYRLASCTNRQFVIVGAGLDTRAYRLPTLAGCTVFELDFPEVFAVKSAILATTDAAAVCERHEHVGVDLSLDTWRAELGKHGYDTEQPSVRALPLMFCRAEHVGVRLAPGAVSLLSFP